MRHHRLAGGPRQCGDGEEFGHAADLDDAGLRKGQRWDQPGEFHRRAGILAGRERNAETAELEQGVVVLRRADRLLDPVEIEVAHFRQQAFRSEEHTSELQSLMRLSYAVFCLHKKTTPKIPYYL